MVVLRLMRAGAKKRPFYRVVAADSRRQRDGRFLEILGHYNPITNPFELVLHKDRIEKWLVSGAQPSVQVASLIRSAGIQVTKPVAAESAVAETPTTAKKKTAKRAKPRKPSERKVRAKAARAKKKGSAKAAKKA